jgi:PilZ domain
MDHTLAPPERRRAARFDAAVLQEFCATLRPGNVVFLVNLSAGGALVHSRRSLRPGARMHLQISGGPQVVRIGAHVMRCGVAALSAADGVVYVGALQFDSHCDLPWPDRAPAGAA